MRLVAVLAALSLPACTGSVEGRGDGDADAGPPSTTPLPPIEPSPTGPADVHVDIDSSRDRHPISRFIYGSNSPDWKRDGALLTLARSGGNRLTAYNWENNASNAGTDWMNQNDAFLGGGETPGEAVRAAAAAALDHGASFIVTVPILGLVAADKRGDGDVGNSADYLATRFKRSHAVKGSAFSTRPDVNDGDVYQDEFVAFMEGALPRRDAQRGLFYCLDNEPDLWPSTHPRIHPDKVRYQELIDRNLEYADAIKAVAPTSKVLGLVSYGWAGYENLQGAPDAGNRNFLDAYLTAVGEHTRATGKRSIDVLDLHWYPEAQGGGKRITDDDAATAVANARVQAPRSLWDPSYTEDSWIIGASTHGPIRLIPRVRARIDAHAPGTELAFSEYYYGGGADISGGIAQADVLGIFGREGITAATLWHIGSTDDRFIRAGFAMFRDPRGDGTGGGDAFGDTSIHAGTDDNARTAVHASVDAATPDRMVVVAINRSRQAVRAAVSIRHGVRFTRALAFRLTSASPIPAAAPEAAIPDTNSFVAQLPAMSVTTYVLTP